ncbi:hypothetical protein, partial [Nostoc sp. NOS(2021)]|uniref:hypothetical protein n=1 Tax=Nostoc sp. NOS(2021) TaxID=2815407 RepID=UPI0025E7C8B7
MAHKILSAFSSSTTATNLPLTFIRFYSGFQVYEIHIKTSPLPLSLVRRGEIKHSFIGVRLSCTSFLLG